MLAADRPPAGIRKIDERLRSRFEGGLVVEVGMGEGTGELELVAVQEPSAKEAIWGGDAEPKAAVVIPPLEELDLGDRAGLFIDRSQPTPAAAPSPPASPVAIETTRRGGAWFPSAENVVLNWPRIESLLQEELE